MPQTQPTKQDFLNVASLLNAAAKKLSLMGGTGAGANFGNVGGIGQWLGRDIGSIKSMAKAIKQLGGNIDLQAKSVDSTLGGIDKKINFLNVHQRDLQLKGKSTLAVEEQINALKKQRKDLESVIWKELHEQALESLKAAGYGEDVAKELLERVELGKKITKLDRKSIEAAVSLANNYKNVNRLIAMRNELYDKYIDNADTLKNKVKTFFDQMRIAAKDPQLNKAMFLSALAIKVADFGRAAKEAFDVLIQSGLSLGQSFKQLGTTIGTSFSLTGILLGISMKDAAEATAGLADTLGNTSKITRTLVQDTALIAKLYGVSNQEAGQFMGMLMQFPGATEQSATNVSNLVIGFAKLNKIPTGQLIKSIAQNTEAFAKFGRQGGLNMVAAATAAKKMGVELSAIETMMSNILDFENSLTKQMEASVLLGREINLDRARDLALEGRVVDATKEVLRNIGGEMEFNRMNVIQRKALADAIGVSVADLSKMVQNQDKLNGLTFNQQRALAEGGVSLDHMLATGKSLVDIFANPTNLLLFFTALNALQGPLVLGAVGKIGAGISKVFAKAGASVQAFAGKLINISRTAPSAPKAGLGLKNLAGGLRSMGALLVRSGAINLGLAGLGFISMTAGALGLAAVAIFGKPAEFGLKGLSRGLMALGKAATGPAWLGVALLGALSVAFIGFGYALNLATPAIEAIGKTIIGVFSSLPPIIKSLSDGIVNITTALANSASRLLLAGGALFTIAGGLSAIAVAGVFAFPILSALTGLALVSPLLIKLSQALNTEHEEPMRSKKDDDIITKLNEIKTAIQQNKQMAVYMDGSKVGYALVTAPNIRGSR